GTHSVIGWQKRNRRRSGEDRYLLWAAAGMSERRGASLRRKAGARVFEAGGVRNQGRTGTWQECAGVPYLRPDRGLRAYQRGLLNVAGRFQSFAGFKV